MTSRRHADRTCGSRRHPQDRGRLAGMGGANGAPPGDCAGRGLGFAFYGGVSTEDYQDPVTSRAPQLGQPRALIAGHGQIVADFFDSGTSRTLAWARRPQATALVAQPADPDRGWDALAIGEYERAFYGRKYASDGALFEHYASSCGSRRPAAGSTSRTESHEQMMLVLGWQSKREIARTKIRVRATMAAQTREQGRYLGGRPPYGYQLADAGRTRTRRTRRGGGRTAWTRPQTTPVVRWMFAQRLAGHSIARSPALERRRSAVPVGGCSEAQPAPQRRGVDGGRNPPGLTASPPTGAATATPARSTPIPGGRWTDDRGRFDHVAGGLAVRAQGAPLGRCWSRAAWRAWPLA
jgi:hypothetical protein